MKNHVKITTFRKILDAFYPCYCLGCGRVGKILCERCIIYNSLINPPTFNDKDKDFKNIFICGMREGILKKMILDFKYKSRKDYVNVLAPIMYKTIRQEDDEGFIIVPLPTIRRHIRTRGFDHIEVLGERLSQVSGWKMEKLLLRNKDTVQVGKDEITRREQAKNAYMIAGDAMVDSKARYLLVDDIWTTGASMRAAARVLGEAGAINIYSLVVAKNGDRW